MGASVATEFLDLFKQPDKNRESKYLMNNISQKTQLGYLHPKYMQGKTCRGRQTTSRHKI